MKTIKQIADELGVSKQAVHQKRKKEPLSTSLQPFTTTVDGVVYISVDGEKMIKQAFNKEEHKQDRKPIDGSFTETVDSSFTPNEAIIDVLLKQSDMLQKELEIKNRQIEELNERLEESHRLIDQQQHLQAMQQKKIEELEKKEEPAPDPAQEGDYDYLLDPEVAADPEVKKRQRDFVKGAFWSKLWRK